ncbi:Hypothetical predicted protein [Olea europaea subsp. europaea]|uniref:Uncharacterized protein n=1 Tax=Olea europaea subsp. europaea TaxID=158383 RepID=A0A8S0V3D1_OLEEU|nr:Hypothetical predicted protein [Olea europaea subsp. europaea]CAA3024447.1 Hypothetical predicted protein [Olea europaea subsp. europaea]
MSEGFHALGFVVGELDTVGTGFFAVEVTDFITEEEVGDLNGALDTDVLRVGVDALDVDFGAGKDCVVVGVEDLMVDLVVGVEDLGGTVGLAEGKVAREVGVADLGGTVGLAEGKVAREVGVADLGGTMGLAEGKVAREVGVADLGETVCLAEGKEAREVGVADLEGLDDVVDVTLDDMMEVNLEAKVSVDLSDTGVKLDLDVELNVGRPVGVAALDPGPPDEEGLRSPPVEVFNPRDDTGCLDNKWLLLASSGWEFASFKRRKQEEEKKIFHNFCR